MMPSKLGFPPAMADCDANRAIPSVAAPAKAVSPPARLIESPFRTFMNTAFGEVSPRRCRSLLIALQLRATQVCADLGGVSKGSPERPTRAPYRAQHSASRSDVRLVARESTCGERED